MSSARNCDLPVALLRCLTSIAADSIRHSAAIKPRPPLAPPQCGTIDDGGPNDGLTERSLQDAQRLYLMNDVVQPESVDPLVMQDDVRFSNLVVDIVQGMDTLYHVIYISTGRPLRGLLFAFFSFFA